MRKIDISSVINIQCCHLEKFRSGYIEKCYDRFYAKGRVFPRGLFYLHSWVNKQDNMICFQLKETDHPDLFSFWFKSWEDLVAFELHPIDESKLEEAQFATLFWRKLNS